MVGPVGVVVEVMGPLERRVVPVAFMAVVVAAVVPRAVDSVQAHRATPLWNGCSSRWRKFPAAHGCKEYKVQLLVGVTIAVESVWDCPE